MQRQEYQQRDTNTRNILLAKRMNEETHRKRNLSKSDKQTISFRPTAFCKNRFCGHPFRILETWEENPHLLYKGRVSTSHFNPSPQFFAVHGSLLGLQTAFLSLHCNVTTMDSTKEVPDHRIKLFELCGKKWGQVGRKMQFTSLADSPAASLAASCPPGL